MMWKSNVVELPDGGYLAWVGPHRGASDDFCWAGTGPTPRAALCDARRKRELGIRTYAAALAKQAADGT